VRDIHCPQHRRALRAKVALPFRKHALEQFVCMGQISERFIGCLGQLRPGIIEFTPAVGVKEPIGPDNVGAFLRHVFKNPADECLRLHMEGAFAMLFRMGVRYGDRIPIVTGNAFLRDRAPANITAHVFVYTLSMLIGRFNIRMPPLTAKFVEKIETLLNAHPIRRLEDLIIRLGSATCSVFLKSLPKIGQKLASKFGCKDLCGKQELSVRIFPAARRIKTPGCNDEVQMAVLLHFIIPALKHPNGSGKGAQPPRILQ